MCVEENGSAALSTINIFLGTASWNFWTSVLAVKDLVRKPSTTLRYLGSESLQVSPSSCSKNFNRCSVT